MAAVPPHHLGDDPLGQPEEPAQVDPGEQGVVRGGVVGERLGDEHAGVVDQRVDAAEPLQRTLDDPVGGGRLRDVALDREHARVRRRPDRPGAGYHRPAAAEVSGHQAGPDALRASGDDGDPPVVPGHPTISAGSLGCWLSGVVSTVIHGSIGSDCKIACISAGLPAVHRPRARERPGSLPPRSRSPCPASCFARRASRASVSSTTWAGVPSGTLMVKVVRNSVPAFTGVSAGSFGCGASGVTSSVRHTRSGIEARTSSSWPSSAAANSASERHSPGRSGGRHRRTRCPAAASSRERAASRTRTSSTAWSGVPSGTRVVIVTRYSMTGSSWSVEVKPRSVREKRTSILLNGPWCYGLHAVAYRLGGPREGKGPRRAS